MEVTLIQFQSCDANQLIILNGTYTDRLEVKYYIFQVPDNQAHKSLYCITLFHYPVSRRLSLAGFTHIDFQHFLQPDLSLKSNKAFFFFLLICGCLCVSH